MMRIDDHDTHCFLPGSIKWFRAGLRRNLILALCILLCSNMTTYAAELPQEALTEESEAAETDSDPEVLDESDESFSEEIVPGVYLTLDEYRALLPDNEEEVDEVAEFDDMNSFLEQPVTVSRYEYEILENLKFIEYAAAILIALIFLLIFRKNS